jgi:hypothetical protein
VDPIGIARALWVDIRTRSTAQGGSTITQQYVKNAFVTPEQTLERKLSEALLAYRIEKSTARIASSSSISTRSTSGTGRTASRRPRRRTSARA